MCVLFFGILWEPLSCKEIRFEDRISSNSWARRAVSIRDRSHLLNRDDLELVCSPVIPWDLTNNLRLLHKLRLDHVVEQTPLLNHQFYGLGTHFASFTNQISWINKSVFRSRFGGGRIEDEQFLVFRLHWNWIIYFWINYVEEREEYVDDDNIWTFELWAPRRLWGRSQLPS